ncbi:MAG: HAD family hydrolase [Lentisphaeria bacterium]|nr:HAD family hydrolase [Lentisphaeria bacterium]
MIYAIDFDGTIVESKFPAIGELKPEAAAFIRELRQRGDKWILNTMREGEHLAAALDFLAIHDLVPDAANDNLPEMCELYNNNPRKIYADIYIDDHNAGGLYLPGESNRDWLHSMTNSQLSKWIARKTNCNVCFPGTPKGERKYWYDWLFKKHTKENEEYC